MGASSLIIRPIRVAIRISLVIGHQQGITVPFCQVIRQERHLAAAAQKIDGKMGNAETGCVALQPRMILRPRFTDVLKWEVPRAGSP
jgi:hypothetical protein